MHLPLDIVICQGVVGGRENLRAYDFVIAKSDSSWIPQAEGPGDDCFFGNVDGYVMLLKQLEGNSQFSTFKRIPLPDGTKVGS